MKLECSKSELLYGVNTVSKAVSSKSNISIMSCILINATDGTIKLTANDTEIGIETVIQGNIQGRGMIALDAKIISDIVRKLPDNTVTIETFEDEKNSDVVTNITCEKAKFTILGFKGDNFTFLPEIEKKTPVLLSYFSLKEVIRQTIFSVADNETNKMMTGELFDIKGNIFKVVSLDGHRISIRKIGLKNEYENTKVIVPGKSLVEVSRILGTDTDKDVEIYFTDRHILFEFENTKVVSRLIEGNYFNIDQMMSSDYETKIKVNKKELFDCIDRATLLVKENDKKPIIININDEKMEMKLNSSIGSMNEDITITKEGKDMMIGFNCKFLIDALKVIDDETISIYLVNPKAPCFIKDAEESYVYLILPVNFATVN